MVNELDDKTKALIKEYVKTLMNEARSPLHEIFTIRDRVRATNASKNGPRFYNVEPGQYILVGVVDSEGHEIITLQDQVGTQIKVVSKTPVGGLTPIGKAIFGS